MNELVEMLQKSSPLIGAIAVPAAGIYVKLRSGRQDPYAIRQMKRHAELHAKLPESGRPHIAGLIQFEAKRYADAIVRKNTRKFNGPNFAAMVLVAVVTGVIVYFGMTVGFVWWPGFVIAVVAAIIGIAFLLVGLQQMYLYEADNVDTGAPPSSGGGPAVVPDPQNVAGNPAQNDDLVSASSSQGA